MKLNFRKIVSVLASTVMISSTIALAAAANYPAPFIQGGSSNVAVVVGSGAATTDYAAVFDINSNLQSDLVGQTTSTSTGSSGISVSGAVSDNVDLGTSTLPLYYNSTLNSARTGVGSTDLPNLLAGGTVTDSQGNQYAYTQTITIGNRSLSYGIPPGSGLQTPIIYVNGGTSSNSPLYTYKLSFSKALNITNTNVVGNTITILGQQYTIGANSAVGTGTDVLYLYGSGTQTTLNEGSQTTVVIDGVSHTIQVTAITQSGSTNQVYVSVDGSTSQAISQGSSTTINGVQIYAKTVIYKTGYAGNPVPSSATLNLGTNVLQLQNGQSVGIGTNGQNSVQGTLVTITETSNALSGLNIAVAMNNSQQAYLSTGQSFVDPVFGGLKLNFVDTNPALNASSSDLFSVNTDGGKSVYVTYNPYYDVLPSGTPLGSPVTAYLLHDNDTTGTIPLSSMSLNDSGGYSIHDTEGEGLFNDEYTIINSGDYGRLVQFVNPNSAGAALTSNSGIQLKDVATGSSSLIGSSTSPALTIGTTGNASITIDSGQTYYFSYNNATGLVNITWGSGAAPGVIGSSERIYPRIKLANGEWFALLTPETLNNGSTYSLPGLDSVASYEAGQKVTFSTATPGADNGATVTYGNVVYGLNVNTANTTATIDGVDVNGNNISFNSTNGNGAILFEEQKKINEAGNSNNGDDIVVPLTTWGSSGSVYPAIGVPKITNVSSEIGGQLTTWTNSGSSNTQTGVDRYGTFLKYDTGSQHSLAISYPTSQMIADIFFTAQGATVSSSVPGSTAIGGSKVLGSVVVTDNQVATVAGKNLIVVGGSCVNQVAAQLLGVTYPTCGDAWQSATGVGVGSFLVQTFSQSDGTVATLVAGYNAADTTNADQYLTTQTGISTAAAAKYVGTSATSATLQTVATGTGSDMTNSTG